MCIYMYFCVWVYMCPSCYLYAFHYHTVPEIISQNIISQLPYTFKTMIKDVIIYYKFRYNIHRQIDYTGHILDCC